MDISSIASNALGGIIASLFVLLLVGMGKHIQVRRKRRKRQPKEILDQALLDSQEYKEILSNRKFHRIEGYAALIWFLCLITVIISAWVLNGNIEMHYKSTWDAVSSLGLLATLACFSPLAFYLGYSPITSHEVEQKRQAIRERKLKEAFGAKPYGYIFKEIIFPVITWLYFIFCVIGLILILLLPPPVAHLPLLLVVIVSGLTTLAGLYFTSLIARRVNLSIKNLPNVPRQRREELRKQLTEHEFEQ